MFSPFLFETIAGSIVIIYLSETVIGPLSDITEIGKNTEDFRYVYIVRMYIFSPDGDLITLNIDQIAYIPTKEKKRWSVLCPLRCRFRYYATSTRSQKHFKGPEHDLPMFYETQ